MQRTKQHLVKHIPIPAEAPMEFTGERMVPEQAWAFLFWEHAYRYRFALPFVAGKRVLDIASGEGYGTAALARGGAQSVIGIDISAEACEHAIARYGIDARVGEATAIPLPDASIDVITSFETIEHVERPEAFIAECARVLAPGGTLIMSTPNRLMYSPEGQHNQFHHKEFTEAEFSNLLNGPFSSIRMYGQSPGRVPAKLAFPFGLWHLPWLKVRGCGRLQIALQKRCCPHILEVADQYREDPPKAILDTFGNLEGVANPYSVWPRSGWNGLDFYYYLAIAQLQTPATPQPINQSPTHNQ